MRNQLSSFGFQSKAAQLTYPFLIFGMLLVHHFIYPQYPELKSAEFSLSLAALIIYIASKKLTKNPSFEPYRAQIRIVEKLLEVFIGVTVISALVYSLFF
jgi:hypothetical protein